MLEVRPQLPYLLQIDFSYFFQDSTQPGLNIASRIFIWIKTINKSLTKKNPENFSQNTNNKDIYKIAWNEIKSKYKERPTPTLKIRHDSTTSNMRWIKKLNKNTYIPLFNTVLGNTEGRKALTHWHEYRGWDLGRVCSLLHLNSSSLDQLFNWSINL